MPSTGRPLLILNLSTMNFAIKAFNCLCFLFLTTFLSSQEIIVCGDHSHESFQNTIHSESQLLKRSGEECFEKCEEWFNPKEIQLYFHVIQNEFGENNFTANDIGWFNSVVDEANVMLDNNDHFSETNLSFNWNSSNISFHQLKDWCESTIPFEVEKPAEIPGFLNVYMIEDCGEWETGTCDVCVGGWAPRLPAPWIVMFRSYYKHVNNTHTFCDEFYNRGGLLIHESAHAATLKHSWPCPGVGEDNCADTDPNDSTNHMTDDACNNTHFTCCQLKVIHDELSNWDYATQAWSNECQASFEVSNVKKNCVLEFTNTSTTSILGANLTHDWCVENLETGEFNTYQTYDLEFDADEDTEYEICLCISDGICESFTCIKENFKPSPAGHTVDVNGNPTDIFCADEDIFFDARASLYESQYFISIWKYNLGGYHLGESNIDYAVNIPEWTKEEAGIIHLNPIWENSPYTFPPHFEEGYEYRIQFALQGPCDRHGWNVIEDILFYVTPCDEGGNGCVALFTTEQKDASNQNDYVATINVTSSNPLLNNNWGVYSHLISGQGPFTYTAFGSANEFEINIHGFPGPTACRTIVNNATLETAECCYAVEVCFDKNGKYQPHQPVIPVDCNVISSYCLQSAPTGLSCGWAAGSLDLVISWEPVQNATGYLLEVTPYDPDCCDLYDGEDQDYAIQTTSTSVSFDYAHECASYQVLAICEVGSFSLPSEKFCFDSSTYCQSGVSGKIIDGKKENKNIALSSKNSRGRIQVYPNPTSGIIKFNIEKNKDQEIQRILMRDIQGRIVSEISTYSDLGQSVIGQWNFDSNYNNGIYFFEVILNNTIKTKKIILIQ